jgi:hypothetical protein
VPPLEFDAVISPFSSPINPFRNLTAHLIGVFPKVTERLTLRAFVRVSKATDSHPKTPSKSLALRYWNLGHIELTLMPTTVTVTFFAVSRSQTV